ncbi:MAG: hypothetical protein HY744_34635 [Deltaproteobacteria bacterium]|nr:hypothetical protein [Deltaproteobacteria bacterium]
MAGLAVSVIVEGDTDDAIVRRVLRDDGFLVAAVYGRRGKGWIDANVRRYNHAARFAPWLVVRDLNHDADCAPELVRQKLPDPAPLMLYRVAVREVEAWLLGDVGGVCRFFAVRPEHVPADPEALADPKAALVTLARRSARRVVRSGMAAGPGSTAAVGPEYVALLGEFAGRHWSWRSAARRCPSLRGLVRALERWRSR